MSHIPDSKGVGTYRFWTVHAICFTIERVEIIEFEKCTRYVSVTVNKILKSNGHEI